MSRESGLLANSILWAALAPEQELVNFVIEVVDDLFLDGKFEVVNDCLQELVRCGLEVFTASVLLAFLSAIQPGREHLPYHRTFFEEVRRVLHSQLQDSARVERLLRAWDSTK